MDEVILFDKSLMERLQEYLEVLSGYEALPVSHIKGEWSFYLELTMDPNGWQAVWKIPRLTCELYKIPFPTIVLVYVENVDFKSLAATVKILAVQDDISLPDKHVVPLIQLWPTRGQDKSIVLSIQSTANALDMLRFFYNNLVLPWDYEDDDTSDWLNKHLESRLRLFYDMKNGTIPKPVAEHLRSLLTEARRLHSRKEQLEKALGDDDDFDLNDGATDDEQLQSLIDLHVRIVQIRGEVEILENPLMRNVILKRQQELMSTTESSTPSHFLVFDEGKVDEYIVFLNQVKNRYPNELVKFVSNLASAIEIANCNDLVILTNTNYALKTTARLESGGIIKGITDTNEAVISSTNEEVMFDFSGNVTLENVTVNAGLSQCGIVVRHGNVTMTNCKIIGDGKSSTHQGIIVLAGSNLNLVDCDISNFCTALVGNSGSKITMRNCVIHEVNYGVKVFDKCVFSAQTSNFRDCREYGVCVETDSISCGEIKIGNFDVLQIVPHVTICDVNGNGNGKGDVKINQKPRIQPIKNIFAVESANGKKESSSDEEMDVPVDDLERTVIENHVSS